MEVVLIIAILIAIAIPTFLGARQRAQDRATQSDLRNGLTAEKVTYTDTQTYSNDTAAGGVLRGIEPALKWGAGLSVALSPDTFSVCLSEVSKSGTTFGILDIATGTAAGTYYAKAACPVLANNTVPAGFGASW
jgi:type IV pilus assembly protein PilA